MVIHEAPIQDQKRTDKIHVFGCHYYQATPGGKVQFTRVQPDDYLARAERKARKAYKGQK
jgi:hypothetical protein